jgi:hypothetical protein
MVTCFCTALAILGHRALNAPVRPGYNELTLQLAIRLHVMSSVQIVTP